MAPEQPKDLVTVNLIVLAAGLSVLYLVLCGCPSWPWTVWSRFRRRLLSSSAGEEGARVGGGMRRGSARVHVEEMLALKTAEEGQQSGGGKGHGGGASAGHPGSVGGR